MNHKFLLELIHFIVLIIKISLSKITFINPYSIPLDDGKFLIIHKDGISICNSLVTEIIENIIIFTEEEKISTEEALSKITSLTKNGYIFCIINDKIYIFDQYGNLLTQEPKDILSNGETASYYTLVSIGITNTLYYYLIGYINNKELNLIFYSYIFETGENKYLVSKKNYSHGFYNSNREFIRSYEIENKGLSCQNMVHSSHGQVLSCYFIIYKDGDYNFVVDYFQVSTNKIILHPNFVPDYYFLGEAKCIKSLLIDFYNSFICLYISNGEGRCKIFNINEQDDGIFHFFPRFICKDAYYGLKVSYYKEKEEYIFSCIIEDGGIGIEFFDKDLNNYEELIKRFDCDIYGYSIIYSNDTNNYYLLSDLNCNNKNCPFTPLNYTKCEEEEKEEEKEEEEKEEEKNIEEEKEEREEEESNKCDALEKCEFCDEDSISKNLCISCNKEKDFYFLYDDLWNNENKHYIDCVNNITKPSNYYFNKINEAYEPCYFTCATCDYGGDETNNNCTSCEKNLIFVPNFINSKNCIYKCQYFYYYTNLGQYKCTEDRVCPEYYSLLIKERDKCINKCEKDNIYKYQYNGECFKDCPINTEHDDNEYLCKDKNVNKCLLYEKEMIFLNEDIKDSEIDKIAKIFAKEFQYTKNHISIFKTDMFSITLYKNSECISDLNLTIPEINFGECYQKIQNHYNINDNLIIAIITKKVNGIIYPKMVSFYMYEPKLGDKINSYDICKDQTIEVKENLLYKIDISKVNIDFILYLTSQNIDVFNLSSVFYTDICFHFKSPIDKDIALKDRILLCFPNITLCENGCKIKGVNLTNLKSICECTFNNFISNSILGSNLLSQSQFGEIEDIY